MRFDLIKPCPCCPFRTDCLEGWLGRDRAEDIAAGLTAGHNFACHETLTYGEEGEPQQTVPEEQHCAGAVIVLSHEGRSNQMMRIMYRLGFFDPAKLVMDSPVFKNLKKFIKHHTENKRRKA
jgi:hypothetical protein